MLAIPALSGQEGARADFVAAHLTHHGMPVQRVGNNIICRVEKGAAKTVMLCSHIDTVPPWEGHKIVETADRIIGRGSNDAGASVACMVAAMKHFAREPLDKNLVLLLAAGEENSLPEGILQALPHVGHIDMAIVGEPTGMRAAIAERGLLVLDAAAHGVSGHAARGEGVNALYKALDDIEKLRRHQFVRMSDTMGAVRLAVTQIEAGSRHNVVPDVCRFVVDVRPTDVYDNDSLVAELQAIVGSELIPRSLANRSSTTPEWLQRVVAEMGIETFVSPTTSDWMRLGTIPAIKMGPGDSARSHAPNEYILLAELEDGVRGFINLLKELKTVASS